MRPKAHVLGKYPRIPTGPLALRVWEHLRDTPRQSAKDIADILGLPRTNTAAVLSEMEGRGQLITEKVEDPRSERTYRLYSVPPAPSAECPGTPPPEESGR